MRLIPGQSEGDGLARKSCLMGDNLRLPSVDQRRIMWAGQLVDATVTGLQHAMDFVQAVREARQKVLMILHSDARLADGEELKAYWHLYNLHYCPGCVDLAAPANVYAAKCSSSLSSTMCALWLGFHTINHTSAIALYTEQSKTLDLMMRV